MPSLQARKRRNMVREMSDQLLEGPDKAVDEEDSDEVSEEDEKPSYFYTSGPIGKIYLEFQNFDS